MRNALKGTRFDVAIDKIAYCSNDIKSAMETVNRDRYIHMSSKAIYQPKHIDTKEEDFDGMAGELVWCSRKDFSYEEIKRQAERALWQKYNDKSWIAVRYPFVIGWDDYTERLLFYVQHVMKSILTDAKLPSYDITLSVNFWLEESSRAMGFVRETNEEHQPEGIDVFKMPAYGYKMAENGAQEMEIFDVPEHSNGYAYVPVEKCSV